MRFLKTFESHDNGMSREEMCDLLCNCGYTMEELEGCSNYELAEMCRNSNKESAETNESSESMSREEMCNYLCKCGYTMNELEECPNYELEKMCREAEEVKSNETNEAKDEKWIKDAIKRPGALRKKMKKEEGEKITKSEIAEEISKLKDKDKDPDKKGIQGLNKKDLTKLRQLNLAKTLKGLKEHQENENYMFFANVQNICNFCQEILSMDKNEVDKILSDGHGWATDHIATSKDDVEEVVNFLRTHTTKSNDSNIGQKVHSMDPDFVKRFTDFPGTHNL
jgi:hypothetical protein